MVFPLMERLDKRVRTSRSRVAPLIALVTFAARAVAPALPLMGGNKRTVLSADAFSGPSLRKTD